jgi:predicted  nucleic acid-binding Zn-ribbon protein
MQTKTFWQRPEGITGGLLLTAAVLGGGYLLYASLPTLIVLASNTLYLAGMLALLAGLIYVVLDPKMRNLIWYLYKSAMRSITGMFVKIDPISILKSYIKALENNLKNLSKQIGQLRGQMRQLKGIIDTNTAEIQKNMQMADKAKQIQDDKNLTLSTRKAGRLQEANAKYDVLYQKMEGLYRMLTKMYENSEIMMEDTRDQVMIKEQEYKAIKASHSAIQSAMSILKGDPDQLAMFDMALEEMAEEVSQKVGEMERFMDTSKNLMDSIDLQKGVFEDEGMRMLETWQGKTELVTPKTAPLDLNAPRKELLKEDNDYHQLFE